VSAEAQPPAARSPALRWDAQHQYVGALLGRRAATVARALAIVPDDAITDPVTRWTYELIRALVAAGRDPHPVSVLHRGRTQSGTRALRPDAPPPQRELRRLGVHLTELYTNVVGPPAIFECARDVLEDAYRTAFHTAGMRMQELAENRTDTEELGVALVAICTRLVDLRHRVTACVAAQSATLPG
jgi:hypothetical protein